MAAEPTATAKFPKTFWTANVIELFERAAYYAMASFMVIYLHENLGMSPSLATTLNSSVLWAIVYFMPLLSGTLADKFGFRRSLSVSFVMIALGYLVMGNIQRIWPGMAGAGTGAKINYLFPVLVGIILIGLGGSIVKPCIAGTVQKTAGTRATLAFAIFYMVINIGSITGRSIAYFARTNLGIPAIFTYVSAVFAVIGLGVVLFIYREPEFVSDGIKDGQQVRTRTLGQAVAGIFVVLRNLKFVFLMIVLALFWFLYLQVYNLIPLFMRHVDPDAPMELYTLANPIMIVCFQMLITKAVKKWTPIRTIILGAVVMTLGMLVNVLPVLLSGDITRKVGVLGLAIPFAGLFVILSIASMAMGEMMASPRIYEYIGAIAPKGQEGLFMGYVSLPIALASLAGGKLGGRMFERFISEPIAAGRPAEYVTMWLIVAAIGASSIVGLIIYNALVRKAKAPQAAG
jgi:POT family proton-dependent oligopeptide transporter